MKQQIELGPNEAICQKWEEAEKGWGTRPDGFSLHVSYESLRKYIDKYWARMPDEPPAVYERPSGTPYPVGVSELVYKAIQNADGGLRFNENYEYPGSGGIDGWLPSSND